jgi:hypothetical protein
MASPLIADVSSEPHRFRTIGQWLVARAEVVGAAVLTAAAVLTPAGAR